MRHYSNKGNKTVKFTDDSIKCCGCFKEFERSINNIAIADDPSHVREYYSTVINSLSQINKCNDGKIVKSLGDRLLYYFLNSLGKNEKAFEEIIEYQLHQEIKSIDPTIKILFVTSLDIEDELKSIIPGISQNQIMKKSFAKKLFKQTVKKFVTSLISIKL